MIHWSLHSLYSPYESSLFSTIHTLVTSFWSMAPTKHCVWTSLRWRAREVNAPVEGIQGQGSQDGCQGGKSTELGVRLSQFHTWLSLSSYVTPGPLGFSFIMCKWGGWLVIFKLEFKDHPEFLFLMHIFGPHENFPMWKSICLISSPSDFDAHHDWRLMKKVMGHVSDFKKTWDRIWIFATLVSFIRAECLLISKSSLFFC